MASNGQHEPVAIVGMGCRWPGGVRSAPDLWKYLTEKADGWREFNDLRWSSKAFHHPNADRPGSMSMKGAFLVEEDARLFDHTFFGITALEAELMDPSQRKLLEVTYEAIENAGETLEGVAGTRTGVFVGNSCLDHWTIQSHDWDNPRPYGFVGAGVNILANRLSYIFNFHGPSLTVDTACSASMHALHLAVNSIRAGDCDSAIVASANWIGEPGFQMALNKLGTLSASARCRTFDANGDGYARAEGYVAIYLKRPSLAISAGLPIRAMIRGTAMNSNGRTGGITRPSAAGQEAVIRDAYRNAGNLPFTDTDYFECHGTGTYVGDPIEVSAIGNVFASGRAPSNPLLVGSVKSNIGHAEGASALAAVMKVVLALENGDIPPIYKLETLNPNIDFDKANVKPVTDLTPWPRSGMKRASINNFGYGGANAHCIIDHTNNVLPDYVKPGLYKGESNGYTNGVDGCRDEQSTPPHHPILKASEKTRSANAATRQLVMLPFSAHNEASLKLNVGKLAQAIESFPLADVAFTLATGRSKLSQRSFCILDKDNAAAGLVVDKPLMRSPLQTNKIGFVFTGQGAQWHAMGGQLFDYQVFRATITYLDHVLGTLPTPPAWTVYDILSGNCEPGLIQTAEVSQTACTAIQVGLVDLLASWSVRPAGVAGHSSGEMAAAYASGRITAAEAIVAAYFRGQAVSRNKQKGAMMAVGLGADQVSIYLEGQEASVKIAAINSPSSVTLSGEVPVIQEISKALSADEVFNRIVKTGDNAYHSHHMVPLGHDYVKMLSDGFDHISNLGLFDPQQRYPRVPWASSVKLGDSFDDFTSPAMYWRANLESPVRFSEAIANLVSQKDNNISSIVEIGPHAALKGPIQQILKSIGKTVAYESTLKRGQNNQESLLHLAGTLFGLNSDIDLAAVNAVDEAHGGGLVHGCTSIDLPPYQYKYGDVNYHESRASKEFRQRKVLRHDLLGSKVIGTAKLRPQWRNILRMKDVPWLGDHRMLSDAILPEAGYLAMAVEAVSRIHNESSDPAQIVGYSLHDVNIKANLTIPENDRGIEVMTSMEFADANADKSPSWATFSISSVSINSEEWKEHCTGQIKIDTLGSSQPTAMRVPKHSSRVVDSNAWYKKFAAIGLGYGPTFQPLSKVHADPENNLATAQLALNTTADSVKGGESSYPIHPASLDGAIQLGLIASHGGRVEEAKAAFVPVQLSEMYLKNGFKGDAGTAVAHGERRGARGAYLNLQMLDGNGEVVLHVGNLRCTTSSQTSKPIDKTFSSPFTRLVWRPDVRTLSNRQAQAIFPPPKENTARSPLWTITNKLAYMVVYDTYEKFGKLEHGPTPSANVAHFFNWVKKLGADDKSEGMEQARRLSSEARHNTIEQLVRRASDVVEVQIIKQLHANMADILFERRTGIDVVWSNDLLTPLYREGLMMTGIHPQLFNMLESLGHANPHQRVLEIGGGTGSATRIAMKALTGPNGIKSYHDYTFTDATAGLLSKARTTFAEYRDMNFTALDIEADPTDQGYQPEHDLIIACQILHATSNMQRTLTNAAKMLKPGGKLVLVETTQNYMALSVVAGTFTTYWNGVPDGRVDAPFMSLESWDSALRKAGFSGTDIVLSDFPAPHNTTSVIVSTFRGPVARYEKPANAQIHLLHSARRLPPLTGQLCQELEQRGMSVDVSLLEMAPKVVPPKAQVILLLDESRVLLNTEEHTLKAFQHLAANASTMIVLTSCGTVKGQNADGGIVSGLLRTLEAENPANQFVSIDVDAKDFEIAGQHVHELSRCIADHQLSLQQEPATSSTSDDECSAKDREFIWQDGALWVSRHVPDASLQSQEERPVAEMLGLDSQGAVRAAFETPGVPASLYFEADKEMWQPLPASHIDVKVTAVGLSETDLSVWSGHTDSNYLSSEYAGVVTATGADVKNVKVGDRVFGLGKGRFGNFTRVPAALAHKLQTTDDDVHMASMPLAHMSAVHIVDNIARLKKGQTILVQSATTSLGLATIQLAQAKGASVFAMVDTPEKVDFLINDIGMSRTSILDLHQTKDLDQAVAATRRGAGFDMVLYAADSMPLQASMKTLSSSGYLIDCGRNIRAQDTEVIGREIVQKNINFSSFDPWELIEGDITLGTELLQTVDNYYRKGSIGVARSYRAVDIGSLNETLPTFTEETPMSKVVVAFTKPDALVKMVPPAPTARFDPEAYYVITGGLGGLGRSIARWMGSRGAQNIALLSRRRASDVPEAEALIEDLAKRGIQITSLVCDITASDQVTQTIEQLSRSRAVKGIVHAAVSYEDTLFSQLSLDQWQQNLAAKVQGTKNLHDATLSMPLDFFVMTTSALSVFALATQSAYTAANNFQDMFARYRQRLGLPASTASFSFINDVGEIAMDPARVDAFERNKAITLSEYQFLNLLEPAFLSGQSIKWSGQQQDPLSASNYLTCLDPALMAAKQREEAEAGTAVNAVPPRWYGDARASLIMRALLDAQKNLTNDSQNDFDAGAQSAVVRLRREFDSKTQATKPDRGEIVAFTEKAIVGSVAELIFISPEDVNPAKSVAGHGVDSLIAAELRNWFVQAFGHNISMLNMLDPDTSISALAGKIVDGKLSA